MNKSVLVILGGSSVAAIGVTVFYFSSSLVDERDVSLSSPMAADRPLFVDGEKPTHFPLHRFSVWDRLAMPVAPSFTMPMGSETGGMVYNAQPFAAMNEKRGGSHLGDDWNGIGGMNTDFGDPIYAAADGIVAYVGEPSAGWGNVVILAHRLEDGSQVQTMYAHLHEVFPSYGKLVQRGQKIGTCGNARGAYLAHLHYEVRLGDGLDIGVGYGALLNRIDPVAFHAAHKPSPEQPAE